MVLQEILPVKLLMFSFFQQKVDFNYIVILACLRFHSSHFIHEGGAKYEKHLAYWRSSIQHLQSLPPIELTCTDNNKYN